MKALITTIPFGEKDRHPLNLLEQSGIEYLINPTGKKYTEQELAEVITDFDFIIAGTEPITDYVMNQASNLKLIARVGIGLDSVDLAAAMRRGIQVSYTPDAPSPAVSELTVGLMLALLRNVHVSNLNMHNGSWYRFIGRRISEVTVGLIGVGRIGKGVVQRVMALGCKRVMVNDMFENNNIFADQKSVQWVDKDTIYTEADIISIHVPLTDSTKYMIGKHELQKMKENAILINTARGGIIKENELYDVLKKRTFEWGSNRCV